MSVIKSWTVFLLLCTLVLLLSKPANAAKNLVIESANDRVALVIGNKDYRIKPLNNPINDAQDMKAALEKVGFRVIYRENADLLAMDAAVHDFIRELNKNSVGVMYYSGHGAQADGSNYLIPVGAEIASKAELKSRAYDVGIVLDEMQEVGNRVNIIILDACRDNPFKGFKGGRDGLATMNGPTGSLIAFATAPGSVADDIPTERNSRYTKYLKRYLTEPELKIQDMLMKVRQAVIKENPDQVPWENSSLIGDFCFAECKIISSSKACDECPEMVQLPQLGIAIGKYEITLRQWRWVMGKDPVLFLLRKNSFIHEWCRADDCPVLYVSWYDIQEFIKRLNQLGDF